MALDLLAFPSYLASVLGINSFTAGMLTSFLFLISVLLAVGQVTKDSKVLSMTGVLAIIVCTGLTWVPVWVPIMIVMIVAVLWGQVVSRVMGG